jgi:hypothetical protein
MYEHKINIKYIHIAYEYKIPSLAILRTPTNMVHESLKMTKEPKETHQDASQ